MDKKENLRRTLQGKEHEWIPASFFLHLKQEQLEDNACIQFHKEFYRETDVDFLKVMHDYGMKLQVTRYEKANYFDPSHPLARIMTNTYNAYMEDSQAPFVMSGGTYARKLPNAFACGTGMKIKNKSKSPFLPGHGDYHQPDEGILVERIRKALVIYILGMLNYCA